MWKWLIRRRLDAFERKYDYNVDYARDILEADTTALLRFGRLEGHENSKSKGKLNLKARPHVVKETAVTALVDADTIALLRFGRLNGLSVYRRDIPLDVYYAVKLIGTLTEDCGPCTQLTVAMALHDGVAPRTIAGVLEGNEDALGDEIGLGVRFARATLAHDPAADDLRDDIVARWGRRALVSLAFAIAAARLFPTIKYALGHGTACQRVVVAGETITPPGRAAASRESPAPLAAVAPASSLLTSPPAVRSVADPHTVPDRDLDHVDLSISR